MSGSQKYYGVFERGEVGFDTTTVSLAHWLAAALAVVSGTLHVFLYVTEGFPGFLVAGLVFYAAAVAVLLNLYRRLLYVLGIPFTAGQIVLWVAQGMPSMDIALIDKPVQLLLIVLLGYLFLTEDDLAGE